MALRVWRLEGEAAMRVDEVQGSVHAPSLRCPYCHDEVQRTDEAVVCRDCNARHHGACWTDGSSSCASCGSTTGLGAVVTTKREPIRQIDPAAYLEFRNLVAEIRSTLAAHRFEFKWWYLLIPHIYIPLFWPFFLFAWLQSQSKGKASVTLLTEKARNVLRAHSLSPASSDLAVLEEAEVWCRS
jgi:hypothetical protein